MFLNLLVGPQFIVVVSVVFFVVYAGNFVVFVVIVAVRCREDVYCC